ncbi:V-type ATP synthase subunit E [Candidatus Aciduliprofundum boonei]|uniref:H+transporting two-sector ATPase E subunit n=1 Tax=Aciduliprofundum boonei (strain DSM 19572 / T469) TaxID=439481 RepID=D3TAE4_ACIB4|nr:V-type ATP synthase subunit E [Candidatus Aciduliprofundum boonei]ADD09073.1 H+transporting two-sector ATPase E subunit [Aciduliprofundum boonei T469]HII55269.1 V-type ATP synthase subunit E [Candidatus Aciduliprofundum boonei]
MDAIDRIIKRIEEDVQWKIKEYWDKADREIERIRNIEESKWDKEREKMESSGKREAETIKQMHISKAHLDGKKMLMNAREKVIERIINQVQISFKDYVNYEKYIRESLEDAKNVLGNNFEVIAMQEDVEMVKRIADDMELNLKVMAGELEYGGILAISSDSLKKVDYTVKAFVERNMGDMRKRIYVKLFGEEYA